MSLPFLSTKFSLCFLIWLFPLSDLSVLGIHLFSSHWKYIRYISAQLSNQFSLLQVSTLTFLTVDTILAWLKLHFGRVEAFKQAHSLLLQNHDRCWGCRSLPQALGRKTLGFIIILWSKILAEAYCIKGALIPLTLTSHVLLQCPC